MNISITQYVHVFCARIPLISVDAGHRGGKWKVETR